jgi:tetratricopeptide (TPR) repeat protein
MKSWLAFLCALSLGGLPSLHWLTSVREHNTALVRGQAAASRGHATEAAYFFGQAAALAGRSGPTPALLLNLAQAQAQAGQLAKARATYGRLLAPTVPAALGSTARHQLAVLLAQAGQPAQAVDLLRQALRQYPANRAARYDYEVLVRYLGGQRPPATPPPAAPTPTPKPPAANQPDSAAGGTDKSKQPSSPAGGNQPGSAAPQPRPAESGDASAPTPDASGQPNSQLPTPSQGNSAQGGLRPGTGRTRPLPSGNAPGNQQGLDQRAGAARTPRGGQGRQPGTAPATDADAQLQTQRERLKAINMSPAQAQQLLEALRTSEQQYLQQRPRTRQGTPPPPGQPTW